MATYQTNRDIVLPASLHRLKCAFFGQPKKITSGYTLSTCPQKISKKGVDCSIVSSNPTGHTSQSSQWHTKSRIAVMVWQVQLLRRCRSFWALWDVRWKEPGVRFWLSAWNSHETVINTQPHGLTLEAARGSEDSWNQSVPTLSYTCRN